MASTKPSDKPEVFIKLLKERFEEFASHFADTDWERVAIKLEEQPKKLKTLLELEKTGGEPSLLEYDSLSDTYVFCDFVKESPAERRSLCYDNEALETRKKFKPSGSAVALANKMGAELMNEECYLKLQAIKQVDTKTSSWINTPTEMRKLGGALFGDYRFGRVFLYHNGAESYYAGRGVRCIVRI